MPWWAGFVSYFVGVLAMLAAVVAPGEPLLSGAMAARASWPSRTGGLFGAVLIGTAILAKAAAAVRGKHDHTVAYDDDSRWSPRCRTMAKATRKYTSPVLSGAQKEFPRGLPLQARVERDGSAFHLAHAKPSDPLHGPSSAGMARHLAPFWQRQIIASIKT